MTSVASTAALEVEGLCKSFKAVRALDQVALSLHYGQVTALLGDNGAGKSTLVKCVSGVYAPDSGVIRVDGTARSIASPEAARSLGVETVHQTLAVIDPLDVVENLFLNRELTRGGRLGAWLGLLDKKRMRAESREILGRLEIRIPSLRRSMSALSGGQRQAVAIGRAAAWGQQIVLLDEPAAALGVEQAARVLDLIRNLRDAGVAVLLITHNMERVISVCDRAVVLRQGRKAVEVEVSEVTKDDLVAYITGAQTGDIDP
ncbi:MAG: ATP-binding cassette domain-containing protein [Acidimicrobiaceae bacterium]|nr:ATP-binding cassette domain-containing protein [Acidimicrobiaceae bacterium]MCY4279648.1 ATP-binding cassette domain-containing protein [Acidimicrobiaceae bacterium]MCY4293332.1 ATP-binding cassette domain-containing protein [Acidimicrobiaceae bacterium]